MDFEIGPSNERLGTREAWWRPLPLWLKLITALVAFPAWFFIVYCIVTGQSNGPAAYVAGAVFFLCAGLHLIFDRRNHTWRN